VVHIEKERCSTYESELISAMILYVM
jgi:hypothetical protein